MDFSQYSAAVKQFGKKAADQAVRELKQEGDLAAAAQTQSAPSPAAQGLTPQAPDEAVNLYPAGIDRNPLEQGLRNTSEAPRMPSPTPIVRAENVAPDLVSAFENAPQPTPEEAVATGANPLGAATSGFMAEAPRVLSNQDRQLTQINKPSFGTLQRAAGATQRVLGISTPLSEANAAEMVNVAKQMPTAIGSGIAKGVAGGLTYLGESPEGSIYADDPAMVERGTRLNQSASELEAQSQKEHPVNTYAGKALVNTAASIGQQLPGLGLAAIGLPQLGIPLMGVQQAAQTYSEDRARGVSIEDALTNASISGGAEMGGELVPLTQFAKGMKQGFSKKVLAEYFLGEQVGEHLTTAVQNSSNVYFDPKWSKEERWQHAQDYLLMQVDQDGKKVALKDSAHFQDQIDTAVQTGLQSVLMGLGGKLARHAKGQTDLTHTQEEELSKYNSDKKTAEDYERYYGKPAPVQPVQPEWMKEPVQDDPASVAALQNSLPQGDGTLSRAARQHNIAAGDTPEAAAARLLAIHGHAVTPVSPTPMSETSTTNPTESAAPVSKESLQPPPAAPENIQPQPTEIPIEKVGTVPATPKPLTPKVNETDKAATAELETQAASIENFIKQIGDTTDPALQDMITKAKENLAAIRKTIPPTEPTSAPAATKATAAAPAPAVEAGSPAPSLPKMQKANIARYVAKLGSMDAVTKHYASQKPTDPRRLHAETVSKQVYGSISGEMPENSNGIRPYNSRDLYKTEPVSPEFSGEFNVPISANGFEVASGPTDRVDRKPLLVESAKQGSERDSELVGDILRSTPFKKQGFGNLNIETQTRMVSAMVRLAHDPQIFNSVVRLIPVDVVDNLRSQKLTPEMIFHNESMLKNALNGKGNSDVALSSERASSLIRSMALAIAKHTPGFRSPDFVGRPDKLSITESANANSQDTPPNKYIVTNIQHKGVKKQGEKGAVEDVFRNILPTLQSSTIVDRVQLPVSEVQSKNDGPGSDLSQPGGKIDGNLPAVSEKVSEKASEVSAVRKTYEVAQDELDIIRPTIKELKKAEPQHVVMDVQPMGGGKSVKLAAPYDGTDGDALRVAKALKLYASEEHNASMRESSVFSVDNEGRPVQQFGHEAGETVAVPYQQGAKTEEVVPETIKPVPTPKIKGADNKIFTEDAYLKAKAVLKAKLDTQLNTGFDPELMQAGISVAGYHMEAGARKFAAFAKAMVEDLGDNIKPYLKSFYNGVRDLPGLHFTGEMDDYGTVSGHDLNKADTTPKESIIQVEKQKKTTGDLFAERYPDKPWLLAGLKDGEFERNKELEGDKKQAESDFFDRMTADPEGMVQEYLDIAHPVDGKPGNRSMLEIMQTGPVTINTDEARPLSPNYIDNPGEFSNAVHEPSSALVKMVWAQALTVPDPRGFNQVLFLGGGGGSGKGSALNKHKGPTNPTEADLRKIEQESQIIFDGTLNDVVKAATLVEMALAASKKKIFIAHVHRGLRQAIEGIVRRKWQGSKLVDGVRIAGRDVPVKAAAHAHYTSTNVFLELAGIYAGNTKVEMIAIDNTGDFDPHHISLDTLRGLVEIKVDGRSLPEFTTHATTLFQETDANPEFNPYIEGGNNHGIVTGITSQIESSSPSERSETDTANTEGSSGNENPSQPVSAGVVRQPQTQRPEGPPGGLTDPAVWWKSLTNNAKAGMLTQVGSKLKNGVTWNFIPAAVKGQILEVRSAQNVISPSNESTGTGSESSTAVTPGEVAPTAGDGTAGDVAGVEPAAIQEPGRQEPDSAAVGTADDSVDPGDGHGSRPAIPASRPPRSHADVQPPAHVVGSARNFTITSDRNFAGIGDKTKYRDNVAAIKLAKQITSELRPATPEEQATLALHVGWGGLPQVFDATKKQWATEHAELKALLTPEEYEAERSSTQDSHYTPYQVYRSMWKAVEHLGLAHGNILFPGFGIGNEAGMMPPGMRSMSTVTAIERDPITGMIAKLLYPQARVSIKGLEEVKLTPDSFDLAFGNPPFGDKGVFDPESKLLSKFKIHGYFFAKSVDSLRPGGVLAMVVSKGLLDANDVRGKQQRDYIAGKTRLLGAIRLPDSAFKANAGTEVTTDIVFLQKLAPGEQSNAGEWNSMESVKEPDTGKGILINKYFAANPEMMLGEMTLRGKMLRGESATLSAREGDNLSDLLQAAIQKLPQGVMTSVKESAELNNAARGPLKSAAMVRPFNLFVEDGKIYQRKPDFNGDIVATPVEATGKTAERITGMIEIRDAVRRQLLLESGEATSDATIDQNRKRLNVLYDAFLKSNGHLNNETNKRLFWEDADSPLVRSLEREFDKGLSKDLAKKKGEAERTPSAKKADIFTKRVLSPSAIVTKVDSALDALSASMSERGRIDLDYMKGIYAKDEEAIISELGAAVYDDPNAGWQVAARYLSGNVKAKLAEAIIASKNDPHYNRNVEALDRVQPVDVPAANIYVAPHSFWVPRSVFEQFATDIFKGTMTGGYSKATSRWSTRFTSSDSIANSSKYGTRRMDGTTIMSLLMENKQIIVKDPGAGKDDPPVINKDETAAAQGKADELTELFQEWIWKDQERRQSVVRLYNDTMNTTVKMKHDGAHLTLPGKVPTFHFRPHQLNVINRSVQDGVVLLDHVVGSGKTAIITATAMELRRLGLARKPMITVPNHLVEQWAASFAKIYPNAKVLAATKKDFKGESRRALFAKIATGDWDAVVIAHSSYKFIPVPRDTQIEILNEQKAEFIEAILEAKREAGKGLSVKKLEAAKDKIDKKLQELADMPKDDMINFQEMGIDALFVDEAHEFKNLFYTTTMQNVAGLGDPSGSGRAFDMFVKTQYLMRRNGGKGVFFATGTPVSNSLAEVYHMQRFLQYDELKARGINNFDAWASAFGKVTTDWEQDAGGRFKQKTRFRSLVNLPELKQLWGSVADTVTNPEIMADAALLGKPFNLPKVEGGKPKNVVVERSPQQAAYIGIPHESLDSNGEVVLSSETGMPIMEYDPGTIVYRMDNWMAEQKAGNTREMPLVITGDARKAGLDFRLIDESAPDWADSKTNTAVKEIIDIYNENTYRKGTQLVFSDLSTPKAHKGKTMEKLAETMPTYFVKSGGEINHVPGKPVELKGLPEEEFFSISKGSGQKRTVSIYERMSGLEIGKGINITEAKADANGKIERQGAEKLTVRLRELAIPSDQIDDYVAKWEEEQATKEDNTEEGESQAAAISFDDVLADSGKSDFSVYDDMRAKLIAGGIPADQVAFIHDYNTDAQKLELFDKVNNGIIRVLLGSTAKMGAGTNVQKRLVGLHHMDAPWKPSDLAQREGRIVRQGNLFWNPESELHDPNFVVKLRRYATKQTYDSRMWEINEIKALSIELFRTGGDDVREVEDVSSESANAAEIKASSSGNPLMLEDLKLKKDVAKYAGMEKSWHRGRYDLEDLVKAVDNKDTWAHKQAVVYEGLKDKVQPKNPEALGLKVGKVLFDGTEKLTPEERAELTQKMGTEIKSAYVRAQKDSTIIPIGSYRGMEIRVDGRYNTVMSLNIHASTGYKLGETDYKGDDKFTLSGLITRLDNIADSIPRNIAQYTDKIATHEKEAVSAREELKQPFKHADALKEAKDKHKQVIAALRQGKTSLDAPAVDNEYETFGKLKTLFSKSGKAKGADAFDVRNTLTVFTANMDNAPAWEVVQSEKELPDALVGEINSIGASGQVRGVFTDNKVFIIADNLNDFDEAETVFVHEIFHYGIKPVLGKRFETVLQQIISTQGKRGLQGVANRYGFDLNNHESRMIAAEEMLAEMAETNTKPGFVNRVIAMIRDWLRKHGAKLSWSDSDIRSLIASTIGYSERSVAQANAFLIGDRFMLADDSAGKPVSFQQSSDNSLLASDRISNFIQSNTLSDAVDYLVQIEVELTPDGKPSDFVNSPSSPVKSSVESMSVDTKILSDVLRSKAFLEHGFSGLDVKTQGAVFSSVIGISHDLQVFDSVISLIPVDVVDKLAIQQITPKMLLNDKSVLTSVFALDGSLNIPSLSGVADTVMRTVALVGAIKSSGIVSLDLPTGPIEGLPTKTATELRHVISSLDNAGVYTRSNAVSQENAPTARFSIRSTDPEVEKRWKAAKGLGDNTPTWKERLTELKDQMLAETQHFPDIDMSTRAGKRTANILRVFEAAGAAAKAKAVSHLQALTNGFNEEQMEAFTRAVILGDLMNEAAKGHELPFGYTPETLIADHLALAAVVNQSPEIQAALQRRKDVNKEMVLQLVENDLLPVESVLKESARDHYRSTGKYDESDINTDYYRHQVLAHAAAKQWAGLSTAGDLRNKKRGWMKERHGSTSDINTNFLEAEFEWFSQSMKELATKKALDEVLQVNDLAPQLKAEAKSEGVEDWKELIPEDHIAWQPVKGSVFYRGQTLSEEAVTKFIEANPAFADIANQFRDVMIMGAKKREAIIPIGLAKTLDDLRDHRENVLLDTINKKLIGAWKINTLLNPHRIIKYNLNNMSGDMDAALAADPAILKYMWPAFKNALARKKGAELTGADKDMLDRGVLDAGISINEIPDINKLPGFKHLSETARSTKLWDSLKSGRLVAILPHNLVAKYFDFVSGWTQVREGLLREAAYLRALELLQQGKPIYWASDAMELNSIPDVKDKAAKLSRELLGDYGAISAHGEKIRTSFIPFWSWMEINSPRYYRIFKNAAMLGEGGSNAARMVGVGTKKVAGAALGLGEKVLLVQLMFALISLYNRWVWPDEEEALGENGRKQLHIIIGKTSEGKALTVRFQGAFSDVLGWVGLEDYPSMIRRYAEGKMDNMDVVKKMLIAAPNKLFNASMPFFKLPAELIAGKSFYPDITKPTSIRDRKEHIARFFTFDNEYRALAGKPSKGYLDGFKSSLVYESDPGEQAYNAIRSQAFTFMEKHGKETMGGEPSARANALYYYRQAKRYEDKTAEAKYLQMYLDEGGKRSKISESINRAAPLASLPTNLRYKFRGSLSPADQETLTRAQEWYRAVYKK